MKSRFVFIFYALVCCNVSIGQRVTSVEAISKARQFANKTDRMAQNNLSVSTLDMMPVTEQELHIEDDVSLVNYGNLVSTQYYANNKTLLGAKVLAGVSAATFVAGTYFIAWARGYHYNKGHYRTDGEGPVDLTVPFNTAIGLLFYTVSVGTAIPAIVLFKKNGGKTESAAQPSLNGSHLFANGYECKLGVYPGGLGINFEF